MSLEHSPARLHGPTAVDSVAQAADHDYWSSLIDEKVAAKFAGLSVRTMQSLRQSGEGPKFIRLSPRCVRYRRSDIGSWAEAKLVSSTSDPGLSADPQPEAA